MARWLPFVIVVLCMSAAHAENNETCIELHCYCNGLGSPSTVAPCSANCYDVCGSSGGSATTGQTRAAHLSRVFLGLTGAQGFSTAYTGGRKAQGDSQVGAQLEAVFGRPVFGLAVFFDLARDAGTSPDPVIAPDPMWLFDFGLGFVVSPIRIKLGRRSVRPELGIYGSNIFRLGCDRCDTDAGLGQVKPAEPDQGYLWRLRAGVDLYLWNTQGLSLDVLVQFGKLGDFNDPQSSAEMRPPRLLFRVAWVPIRDR